MADEPEYWRPFMLRPDVAPASPRSTHLERRGPREFVMVFTTRDGAVSETKLSAGATAGFSTGFIAPPT